MTEAQQSADYLSVQDISVNYGRRQVLTSLSVSFPRGEITALVGPNGCGKSTLLKAMARLVTPAAGNVTLDGVDVHVESGRAIARQLAILPQNPVAPPHLTVSELVAQGRYPHTGAFRFLRRNDAEAVRIALQMTELVGFEDRNVVALSGGERQRAWIALALAQATPLLLLDEPTTYLDVGHQIEILDLVKKLNRERRTTVIMVLHDLNQAARYADRMVVLQNGRVYGDGAPAEIMTETMLQNVFNVRATIVADPVTGTPAFFPGRK